MRTSLRERERGRNIGREGVRAISVRSKQKPFPSSNLPVNAHEHVCATEPELQSGLQDASFTGTSRSLQVAHLGTPGNESQRGGGGGETCRSSWNRKKLHLRNVEEESRMVSQLVNASIRLFIRSS